MNEAVKELSSALLVAQKASSTDEFLSVRKSVAHIIASVDDLLYESIYGDHPELNDLGRDE
jgi:hypothetical protein